MSPKSRGRPKGRGRRGKSRSPRRDDPIALIVDQARSLVREEDAVLAEAWASELLGTTWDAARQAEDGDGTDAEVALVAMLAERVQRHPSAAGLAALHAFARVAPAEGGPIARAVIAAMPATLPPPAFTAAPLPEPVRAWTAVDVWGAERMIFVEYEQPEVHTLVAQVLDVAGRLVESLALAMGGQVAQDWAAHRDEDDVPMEPVETPVADALADLVDALASTELAADPPVTEDFVSLRALAWARAVEYATEPRDREPTPSEAKERLVEEFLATGVVPDDETSRRLARAFVEFGDMALADGPLAWSPIAVLGMLGAGLPGRVPLDDDEVTALPDVLRAWLRFALERREVPERWIEPVLDAVDEGMRSYREALEPAEAE